MAGGAETPNIAALPAIARLGTCESARGPDADRHVKLLIQFAVEGSLAGAYSQSGSRHRLPSSNPAQHLRGHTEGPEERPPHAFAVSKTRFLRYDVNRVPPFLHHEPGRFQPKPLHCFCR